MISLCVVMWGTPGGPAGVFCPGGGIYTVRIPLLCILNGMQSGGVIREIA